MLLRQDRILGPLDRESVRDMAPSCGDISANALKYIRRCWKKQLCGYNKSNIITLGI